jgi:hypothetical protein
LKQLPFTQIRRQLLESSVWEDENPWVRVLWVTILMVADEPGRDGRVDMTVRALAGRACMSEDATLTALATLTAPDPKSRSKKSDGRRLQLIDPERTWGWGVVNWEEYQADRKRFSDAIRKREERAFDRAISSDPVRERPFVSDSVQERPKKSPDKIRTRQDKDTYPAGFVDFWAKYPRNAGKAPAAAVWSKMSEEDRTLALAAVGAFAEVWAARPKEEISFCPYAKTWLNQRRWEDDGLIKPPKTADEVKREQEREFWRKKREEAEQQQREERQALLKELGS